VNYVIHFGITPFPVVKYEFPYTVPLCSHGTYLLVRDATGRVLTDIGKEPCFVAHMHNRYDSIKGWIRKELPLTKITNDFYGYVFPRDSELSGSSQQVFIDSICARSEAEIVEVLFLCRFQCDLSNKQIEHKENQMSNRPLRYTEA